MFEQVKPPLGLGIDAELAKRLDSRDTAFIDALGAPILKNYAAAYAIKSSQPTPETRDANSRAVIYAEQEMERLMGRRQAYRSARALRITWDTIQELRGVLTTSPDPSHFDLLEQLICEQVPTLYKESLAMIRRIEAAF